MNSEGGIIKDKKNQATEKEQRMRFVLSAGSYWE